MRQRVRNRGRTSLALPAAHFSRDKGQGNDYAIRIASMVSLQPANRQVYAANENWQVKSNRNDKHAWLQGYRFQKQTLAGA